MGIRAIQVKRDVPRVVYRTETEQEKPMTADKPPLAPGYRYLEPGEPKRWDDLGWNPVMQDWRLVDGGAPVHAGRIKREEQVPGMVYCRREANQSMRDEIAVVLDRLCRAAEIELSEDVDDAVAGLELRLRDYVLLRDSAMEGLTND